MKKVSIYCPDDLHEQLRTVAFHERTSINQLVLEAVRQSLAAKAAKQKRKAQRKGGKDG